MCVLVACNIFCACGCTCLVQCNSTCPAPAEEYNYYNSGLLPSMFYQSLAGKDLPSFKTDLWIAAVVVISVCIVSKCIKTLAIRWAPRMCVCVCVCVCVFVFVWCGYVGVWRLPQSISCQS